MVWSHRPGVGEYFELSYSSEKHLTATSDFYSIVCMKIHTRFCVWVLLIGAFGIFSVPVFSQSSDSLQVILLDEIEVVDVTYLPGTSLRINQIAQPVQVFTRDHNAFSWNLASDLQEGIGGIQINNLGSNPLQPEISYRGFSVSPLLGLPQGLSVYQDGVRVNEIFGDIVNWDLFPETAIAKVTLMPGSNPLFGRNTLGGALSVSTKSGISHPGISLEMFGESFGRLGSALEYGGRIRDHWGYFVTGTYFRESGWRDFSKSDAGNLFGKLNYISGQTNADFSFILAQSDLRGNGAVPLELLNARRKSVFTHPDNTNNSMVSATLRGEHQFSSSFTLQNVTYVRFMNARTLNGDDSDYGICSFNTSLLCFGGDEEEEFEESENQEERLVFDMQGTAIAAGSDVLGATNNTTQTVQRTFGTSIQGNLSSNMLRGSNQLIIGLDFDTGFSKFDGQTELAQLLRNRGTRGSGFIDLESVIDVNSLASNMGIYFSNTLLPVPFLALTLSGRFNYSKVILRDQIGEDLNGNHSFSRFNPAIGVSIAMGQRTNAYISASTSNRIPTPVELTCADPEDPCRLPNSFQADPPLSQVVATTYDVGFKGRISTLDWSVGGYLIHINNNIYFVSSGPGRNSGFFTNIGDTRQRGVEITAKHQAKSLSCFIGYTFLLSTFEEDFVVSSPNHPLADEGEIEVKNGSQVPMTPKHVFSSTMDFQFAEWINVGGRFIYNGDQYFRGDEGNLLSPINSYLVIDVYARYQVSSNLIFFFGVDNLLDRTYETAGVFGEAEEVHLTELANETIVDFNPLFLTPGPPRTYRLGLKVLL